jgi:16S rRNA (uracil1498-N3)-methyltransferase
MPDPWILVPRGNLAAGTILRLDREESRHAANALRLRAGDAVVLTDGCGTVARAVMSAVDSRKSEAEISDVRIESPPPGTGVTLSLAALHGQAMDWAVQKAVEIGVCAFVPIRTERCQLSLQVVRTRLDHWRRVALQSLKQCRRPWAMDVLEPVELADFVALHGEDGCLVADRAGTPLGEMAEVPPFLMVGPEGGFSPIEEQLLKDSGWPKVRLGEYVLRAETAAVVGAAMLVARHEGLGTRD